MTWLTWRQFRAQAATAAAALAVFAVLLTVTGPHLASVYAASGITGCHGGSCGQLASNFLTTVGTGIDSVVYILTIAVIILAPALTGIFWGPRSSPVSSKPGRSGWPGPRPSPGPGGWRSSSR